MAIEIWVLIDNKRCELIQEDVALEELRAFPDGLNYEPGCYLVLGRRCTADVACNISGIQCQWAYTNPTIDRFEIDS